MFSTLYILDQFNFLDHNIHPTAPRLPHFVTSCTVSSAIDKNTIDVHLWHRRFGHASATALKHISFLPKVLFPDLTKSSICPLSKQHRLPFSPSTMHSISPFELLHIDLWGPYRHNFLSGVRFMVTIVDDFTSATWTYLISHKSQALTILTNFIKMVSIHFNKNVQTIRSDNGTKFTNNVFQSFLS